MALGGRDGRCGCPELLECMKQEIKVMEDIIQQVNDGPLKFESSEIGELEATMHLQCANQGCDCEGPIIVCLEMSKENYSTATWLAASSLHTRYGRGP